MTIGGVLNGQERVRRLPNSNVSVLGGIGHRRLTVRMEIGASRIYLATQSAKKKKFFLALVRSCYGIR